MVFKCCCCHSWTGEDRWEALSPFLALPWALPWPGEVTGFAGCQNSVWIKFASLPGSNPQAQGSRVGKELWALFLRDPAGLSSPCPALGSHSPKSPWQCPSWAQGWALGVFCADTELELQEPLIHPGGLTPSPGSFPCRRSPGGTGGAGHIWGRLWWSPVPTGVPPSLLWCGDGWGSGLQNQGDGQDSQSGGAECTLWVHPQGPGVQGKHTGGCRFWGAALPQPLRQSFWDLLSSPQGWCFPHPPWEGGPISLKKGN